MTVADAEIVLNRPDMQRQEIGPLVASWGDSMYQDFEARAVVETGGAGMQVGSTVGMIDLGDFADRCKSLLADIVIREVGSTVGCAEIDEMFKNWHLKVCQKQGFRPTYMSAPRAMMLEGMVTGVVLPINLAFLMSIERVADIDFRRSSEEYLTELHELEFSVPDIVTLLRRPVFSNLLIESAFAPNGYYEKSSAKVNKDALAELAYRQLYDKSAFRADGTVRADPVGRLRRRDAVKRANERKRSDEYPEDEGIRTSGCPVRHDEFPVVGSQLASKILSMEGFVGPNELSQSLIATGIQTTAKVLESAMA